MKSYPFLLLRTGLLVCLLAAAGLFMNTQVTANPPMPPSTIGEAKPIEITSIIVSDVTPCYDGCGGVANPPTSNADYEQQVIELVNRERWNNGQLPPLKREDSLTDAARYHANDMGQDNYFDHDTYDRTGGNLVFVCKTGDRIVGYYGSGWSTWAENIAAGYTTPEAVMFGWMDSPGHRTNILNPNIREIGVGYASVSGSEYTHYWVQNFGAKSARYPIIINREAATTENPQVDLYIYGAGTWTEMRLRNNNDTWTGWQSFKTNVVWDLPQTKGMHTVTVELRNAGGSTTSSDTIYLDWTPTPIPSPTAPTDLSITRISGCTVTLTWRDNSDNEDGFIIKRTQTPLSLIDSYVEVGRVNENVTTYVDFGMNSTLYYYRVAAYNANGISTAEEGVSDTTGDCLFVYLPSVLRATGSR